MSHHEKFAWGSLFASLLAWSFLTMRMTDSGAVVILMIAAHALIAGLLSARAGSEVRKDERDLAIAARCRYCSTRC